MLFQLCLLQDVKQVGTNVGVKILVLLTEELYDISKNVNISRLRHPYSSE
jgi:hypothetical protein